MQEAGRQTDLDVGPHGGVSTPARGPKDSDHRFVRFMGVFRGVFSRKSDIR